MKRWVLLACWIFLEACSPDESKERVLQTHAEIPIASCHASKEDPFYCVVQACQKVAGKYDLVTQTCDCQDPDYVFTPYEGGQCLPISKFNTELSKSLFVLNGAVDRWILNSKIPILPVDFFQMQIVNEQFQNRRSLIENLFVTEIELFDDPGTRGSWRYYWESDPKRWPNLLQRRRYSFPSTLTLPNHPLLVDIWKITQDSKQKREQYIEFFTQDGCAGHCIIQYRYPSFKNQRILEINEYVGGLSVRHQVIIEQEVSSIYQANYAVIEIDPSDSPNLVYLTENKLDSSSGDLLRKTDIYSRTGELLYSSEVSKFIEHMNQELILRDSHKNSSELSVVICDSGVLPSSIPRFRVGPRTDKSFWGWVEPEFEEQELSLWQQLSGVKYLSEVNQGYFHGMDLRRHGASVSQLATRNTDFSVISMTADQCFSHYKQWKKNVQPFARVVNVSAAFYYDRVACEQEPRFKNSLGDPEQPFLWVLAAGNEHRENLTAEKSSLCPQSLGPRSNMLVVTAINAGYANTGVNYADIAADGLDYYENQPGTSYAAPRVARVAALLAQEFPSLSIAQIREAILSGARVPKRRLPVRSGGYLDEAGARAAARKIYDSKKNPH